MNETNPTPPTFPTPPPPLPPAVDPAEQVPGTGFVATVEAVLRQPGRVLAQLRRPDGASVTAALLAAAFGGALVYGLVAGTFSGGVQLWAAPLKVAVGLLLSALICLPSLYIFACLGGSQARLREVVGVLASVLALMTLLLLGFAPVAWVFAQSTDSLAMMGALHLLFWGIATAFALRLLTTGFRQSQSRSLAGVRVWMCIFVLVMVQMTTSLRPILGKSDTLLPQEKKFFAAHWIQCLSVEADRKSSQRSRE
jgi:hypothetical protein